jgi:hypothetical protein
MLKLLATGLAIVSLGVAQTPSASPDALEALSPLIGRWVGSSDGQPGKGQVEREYARILNARFIEVRNRSVYPPQEKNPKGETHEDMGIYSFDSARKRIVFRQFHVEGFVNQYMQDPGGKPTVLVFTSEAIENIPAGWRARETLTLVGPDEFEELFELAEPGKEFEMYSRARLKRAR